MPILVLPAFGTISIDIYLATEITISLHKLLGKVDTFNHAVAEGLGIQSMEERTTLTFLSLCYLVCRLFLLIALRWHHLLRLRVHRLVVSTGNSGCWYTLLHAGCSLLLISLVDTALVLLPGAITGGGGRLWMEVRRRVCPFLSAHRCEHVDMLVCLC